MAWSFSVGPTKGGDESWWLNSSNGEMVAWAGETFASRSNADRACRNFKAQASSWNYDVYADAGGVYRWRALSSTGSKVAASGESFDSRSNAQRAADNVKANAGGAVGP